MICAFVNNASANDFVDLLKKSRENTLKYVQSNPAKFKTVKAVEFEKLVCDMAKSAAKGTIFDGKIEQTGPIWSVLF